MYSTYMYTKLSTMKDKEVGSECIIIRVIKA